MLCERRVRTEFLGRFLRRTDDGSVEKRSKHNANHEGGKDVAEWKSEKNGEFLEEWYPEKGEEVYGTFETETKNKEKRACEI